MTKSAVASTDTESYTPAKKPKKKMKRWKKIVLGIISFLGLIVFYGLQPVTGSIHVGICRTFAELQLKYPPSFKFLSYDQFGNSHRIYYSFIGPFGENRSNMIECTFSGDDDPPLRILSIKVNRQEIDEETIDRFNKTIPTIVASNPDLTLPPAPNGPLVDLKNEGQFMGKLRDLGL